jgi:predicted transcriptional regulator
MEKKENIKTFAQIRKELLGKGIDIIRVLATLNGKQCYKIHGKGFNRAAIFTAADIKQAYYEGEFV